MTSGFLKARNNHPMPGKTFGNEGTGGLPAHGKAIILHDAEIESERGRAIAVGPF